MGNLYSDEEKGEQGAFPDWAVKFQDGTWQSGGHGFHRSGEAFYADRYETQETAHWSAKQTQKDHNDTMPYEVVPAWEPLCESLRHEINNLRRVAKIDTRELFDVSFELEMAYDRVQQLLRGKDE